MNREPRRASKPAPATNWPTTDIAYLGVDGGGSKSRALLEFAGHLSARIEHSGINPVDIGYREFERRLRSLVGPLLAGLAAGIGGAPGKGQGRRLAGKPGFAAKPVSVSACLALAGVGKLAVRRRCRAITSRVVNTYVARRRLTLMTDAEGLVHTCLGRSDGVVLIAGTGSIAVGVRQIGGGGGDVRARGGGRGDVGRMEVVGWDVRAGGAKARVVRVGGRGGLSDAGSGFRIGMGLIHHALRVLDGTEKQSSGVRLLCQRCHTRLKDVPSVFLGADRSRVASLAPIVLEAYRGGDAAARSILTEAVRDLADLVVSAGGQAGLPDKYRVYLAGGLFASPAFRRLFERELRRVAPGTTPRYIADPLFAVMSLVQDLIARGHPSQAPLRWRRQKLQARPHGPAAEAGLNPATPAAYRP